MDNGIPKEFKVIFWDAKLEDLDLQKHKTYIIEHILYLGDLKEIKWLFGKYDLEEIRQVASKSTMIDKKAKNFYLNVYK